MDGVAADEVARPVAGTVDEVVGPSARCRGRDHGRVAGPATVD